MIIIILLICLIVFILGLAYILISHALSSILFFNPIVIKAREEKRIARAFDKAYESVPNAKHSKRLRKAEWRYRIFLLQMKEKEAISILNEAKWVI